MCLFAVPLVGRGLQIDGPQHHFGVVNHADELVHTWVLHNESEGEVMRIRTVSLGCDVCMQYALETKELAPGQSVDLTVWLDASTLEGPIKKEVLIQMAQPRGDVFRLQMDAVVRQPYCAFILWMEQANPFLDRCGCEQRKSCRGRWLR